MKRILSNLTVMIASMMMLTACTKCTGDRPAEMPPVVEPPQGAPPAVDGSLPGDISAMPPAQESAPAK